MSLANNLKKLFGLGSWGLLSGFWLSPLSFATSPELKREVGFTMRSLVGLIDFIRRDEGLASQTTDILKDCILFLRSSPAGQVWTDQSFLKPQKFKLAFGKTPPDQSCGQVISLWFKRLRKEPGGEKLYQNQKAILNQVPAQLGDLFGPPKKENLESDVFVTVAFKEIDRAKIQSRLGNDFNLDSLLEFDKNLFQNLGSVISKKAISNSLRTISAVLNDDQKSAPESVIAAQSDRVAAVGAKYLRDCLHLAKTFSRTAACVNDVADSAQRSTLLAMVEATRETNPIRASGDQAYSVKQALLAGVWSASRSQKVSKLSNAELWSILVKEGGTRGIKTLLEEWITRLELASGLKPGVRERVHGLVERGVAELLGAKPTKLINSIAIGGRANFLECINNANETFEGIKERAICVRDLSQKLDEAGLEWVLRHVGEVDPSFSILADASNDAIKKVYRNGKVGSTASDRIEALFLNTVKGVAKAGARQLVHNLARQTRSPEEMSEGEKSVEEFEAQVERAVESAWGTSPLAAGDEKIVSSRTVRGKTVHECLQAAGSLSSKGDQWKSRVICFQESRDVLDDYAAEWITKNFPMTGSRGRMFSEAVRAAGAKVFTVENKKRTDVQRAELLATELHRELLDRGLSKARGGTTVIVKGDSLSKQKQQEERLMAWNALQQSALGESDRVTPEILKDARITEDPKAQTWKIAANAPGLNAVGTQVIKRVGDSKAVQDGFNHVIGRILFGSGAGYEAFSDSSRKQGDVFDKTRKEVRDAIKTLSPELGVSPGQFIQSLNQTRLAQASGKIIKPVIDEMQWQVSCIRFPKRKGPGPDCGCLTNGGMLKGKAGNIFGSELSMVVRLLRDASLYDQGEEANTSLNGKSCRGVVGEFLDTLPDLARTNGGVEFFQSPVAFLGAAFRAEQKKSPSVISCMTVGMIKKHVVSKVLSGASSARLGVVEALRPLLTVKGLMNLVENDPEVKGRLDDLTKNLAKRFENPASKEEEVSWAQGLRREIAEKASDIAALALTSPLVYRPVIQHLKTDTSFSKRKIEQALALTRGQAAPQILTKPELDDLFLKKPKEMARIGETLMGPFAILAGAATLDVIQNPADRSALDPERCEDENIKIPQNPIQLASIRKKAEELSVLRCGSAERTDWNSDIAGASTLVELMRDVKGAFSGVDGFLSATASVVGATVQTNKASVVQRIVDTHNEIDRLKKAVGEVTLLR